MNYDMLGGVLAVLGVLFFVGMFGLIIISADTSQKCRAAGWGEASITWNLEKYCHREENEFEITKPLNEVLQEVN